MTTLVRTRKGALAVAVALGALSTLLLYGYVRGLESRAYASAEPVDVLIATEDIAAGTPAGDMASRIRAQKLPKSAVATGAVKSLDELKGLSASADILAGEQILSGRFRAGARRGLLPIPADRQAVSVEVGVPPGVAGFVEPGDHVSIIARADVPGPGGATPKAQYLVQDVSVLSVGRRVVTESDEGDVAPTRSEDRVLLTLALAPADAEKVVLSVTSGEIWFTLLPKGQAPAPTAGRTPADLFS